VECVSAFRLPSGGIPRIVCARLLLTMDSGTIEDSPASDTLSFVDSTPSRRRGFIT
jgi:hypothetical protein